ncbi:hypothetical protein GlitD10_1142 [Gloeomargarita lithophora Alchichica-D10]|uniref:DUF4189 domain-containing protein n=1 Tax=Gloeomargarita lithophora Alchichica-D10 TaxID=1188229 RepID=A0A1J0ABZ9_9CYAN|nr:DUF4189 domain-containing protein [Gloeomargarita lithophora]APB33462.1 hypothetical protein GlitD10_1142 [Gloeomargarita lithophora Alchichica-D10]
MLRPHWFWLLLPTVLWSLPAQAQESFGAIALGKNSSRFGYSYDWKNSSQATQRALRECGSPDCQVVLTFNNGCGAVAESANRTGVGTGKTRNLAEQAALKLCNEPGCKVTVWACNSR